MADEKSDIAPSKFVYRDKFSRNGWLNMLNERLRLAKQLLKDDGVIFVSIDDNEQAYLKVLMDEIFGEENFVATIIFNKTAQGQAFRKKELRKGEDSNSKFKRVHEYIHCYQKTNSFILKPDTKVFDLQKYKYRDEIGNYAITNGLNSINSGLLNNKNRGYTIYYNKEKNDCKLLFEYDKETLIFVPTYNNKLIEEGYIPIRPGLRKNVQTCWNWSAETFSNNWKTEIIFKKDKNNQIFPYIKNRYKETKTPMTIIQFDTRLEGNKLLYEIFSNVPFSFSKPLSLISYLIDKQINRNARILDFYAGSGTTGHAVMELNKADGGKRTYTLVTNNENNIGYDVCYERLYRINNGLGTNNETFEWAKKNNPYKQNLNVFSIDYYDTSILKKDDNDSIAKIKKALNKEIEEFGIIPSANFNVDIYYDLLSLKPILKVGK